MFSGTMHILMFRDVSFLLFQDIFWGGEQLTQMEKALVLKRSPE